MNVPRVWGTTLRDNATLALGTTTPTELLQLRLVTTAPNLVIVATGTVRSPGEAEATSVDICVPSVSLDGVVQRGARCRCTTLAQPYAIIVPLAGIAPGIHLVRLNWRMTGPSVDGANCSAGTAPENEHASLVVFEIGTGGLKGDPLDPL